LSESNKLFVLLHDRKFVYTGEGNALQCLICLKNHIKGNNCFDKCFSRQAKARMVLHSAGTEKRTMHLKPLRPERMRKQTGGQVKAQRVLQIPMPDTKQWKLQKMI